MRNDTCNNSKTYIYIRTGSGSVINLRIDNYARHLRYCG